MTGSRKHFLTKGIKQSRSSRYADDERCSRRAKSTRLSSKFMTWPTAVACLGLVSGCVREVAPEADLLESRPVLDSRAVTDGCQVYPTVREYFASGEFDNAPTRFPRSFDEYLFGHTPYVAQDPERYRAQSQNRYEYMLNFILSEDDYVIQNQCSSRVIVGSRLEVVGDWEDDYASWGAQAFNFYSPDAQRLCVRTSGDEDVMPPFVTVWSCTDSTTGRNTFDVFFDQ